MSFWILSFFLIVPILIHLLNLRRFKRYYISSIRQLSSLSVKTKSVRRIKSYLILINRVFLFGSVFLLLYQFLSESDKFTTESVSIFYDNSPSNSIKESAILVDKLTDIEEIDLVFVTNTGSYTNSESIEASPQTVVNREITDVIKELNENSKRIIIYSDFQGVFEGELSDVIDTARIYTILKNNLEDVTNAYIDTLYVLPNPEDLDKRSILFKVGFSGESSDGNVVVRLLKGTKQVASIVVESNNKQLLSLDISKELSGDFVLKLDGDQVFYDNEFYFRIDEAAKTNVSLLDNSKEKNISKVFSNRALFQLENVDLNSLDYSETSEIDLLILNAFTKLPIGIVNQLKNSDILVIPNDSVSIVSYGQILGANISKQNDPMNIDIDVNHPLFKGIFESNIDQELSIYGTPLLEIPANYEPIILYRDGTIFLGKNENVYFLNSSIKLDRSNFSTQSLFLPILYQIAFASSELDITPYYYPNDFLELNANPSDIPIKMVRADFEVIPEFNSRLDRTTIKIPQNVSPGNYHFVRKNDTLKSISINLPKKESLMEALSLANLREFASDYDNVEVVDAGKLDQYKYAQGYESSLWKYVLILIIAFTITETMLHRFLK